MSGTNNSTVNVGPTAESLNVAYGDATPKSLSPRRHLSNLQFSGVPVDILSPTEDNGWLGPLGSYGNTLPAGSLYGYGASEGVSSGYPQY